MSTPQLPLKPVLTEEQVNRIWKNITSPLRDREPGHRHWLGRPLFLVTTCLALATDHLWLQSDRRLRLLAMTVMAANMAVWAFFLPIISAGPLAGKLSYVPWMWLASWR